MNVLLRFFGFLRFSFLDMLVLVLLGSILFLASGNRYRQARSNCGVAERGVVLEKALNAVVLHNLCEIGDEVQYANLEKLEGRLYAIAWYFDPVKHRVSQIYSSGSNAKAPPLMTRYLDEISIPAGMISVRREHGCVDEIPATYLVFGNRFPPAHVYAGRHFQIGDYNIGKNPSGDYRAYTPGPFIDTPLEKSYSAGETIQPAMIAYDPSNGLYSHGYLSRSAPGNFSRSVACGDVHTTESHFP